MELWRKIEQIIVFQIFISNIDLPVGIIRRDFSISDVKYLIALMACITGH